MQLPASAEQLAAAADEAAGFLRALAHPSRLQMVCALLGGELTAGAIAVRTGLRPPAVSQQAAILETEGLIRRRRVAQAVYYSLASPAVRAQARLLHRLFCGRARR